MSQFRSANSIILYNKDYFFKCYQSDMVDVKLIYEKCKGCQNVVETISGPYLRLLKFPALLSPLANREAIRCLANFLELLKDALDALHALGLAHLDVRLPNVCFKSHQEQFIAVLIDLDRAKSVSSMETLPYHGDMYQKPSNWTVAHLDWKQVGLFGKRIDLHDRKFWDSLITKGS